jgi:hypothetical protein
VTTPIVVLEKVLVHTCYSDSHEKFQLERPSVVDLAAATCP